MLKLFIGNKNYSSWSLRPWILLKELEIAFEEELVHFAGSDTYGIFRRFSPSGKVPCLIDGETVVWDSMAIIEYVAELEQAVWPLDRVARAWARSAAAEIHSGFSDIRNDCAMSCGVRIKLYKITEALLADWARLDELWCEGLSRFGGPFLAGDKFSAVDAFYAPVAFRIQTYSPGLSQTAMAYARRLLDLPNMRDWYEAGLAETWRDEPHDLELQEAGEWLEDLRASPVSG